MSEYLDQAAIDEAIALGMNLQFDDLYLTINDSDDIALKIKQKEEASLIRDDEEYARFLQSQEDEELAKQYDMEENSPNIPQPDVPSTSRETGGPSNGDRSHDQPMQVDSSVIQESNSLPNQTAILNDNPQLELGESTAEVSKEGLAENIISGLPTHKYGRKIWWWQKKTFVPDKTQCSICLLDYEKGDKITMLPCKHAYHKDCISNWLQENKVCSECQVDINP